MEAGTAMMGGGSALDIHKILTALPHRYPFLLVDRVLESVPGERLVALKNVTVNEPFFVGHFPVRPVMPGVLVLEAMVQASSLFVVAAYGERPAGTLHYLAGVENSKFRRPVEPGDQLVLTVTQRRIIRNLGCFDTTAEVGGHVAATARIWCASKEVGD